MPTVTFDTLEYAKKLKKVGFTDEQAEAQAEAQKDMLSEVLGATLASKDDIHNLKGDVNNLRTEVKDDINRLEKQVASDINRLEKQIVVLKMDDGCHAGWCNIPCYESLFHPIKSPNSLSYSFLDSPNKLVPEYIIENSNLVIDTQNLINDKFSHSDKVEKA